MKGPAVILEADNCQAPPKDSDIVHHTCSHVHHAMFAGIPQTFSQILKTFSDSLEGCTLIHMRAQALVQGRALTPYRARTPYLDAQNVRQNGSAGMSKFHKACRH